MRMRLPILLIFWFTSACTCTAGDFTVPARTSVPYTYCIWYLSDPLREDFLESLRASPPDLFHLGYHIPFKGALGPTYGHELFTDEILPVNEIPRETERIHRVLSEMRSAGVGRIIPYVYTMAFFGDPQQRSGFFRFFDRWDEYRAFGLGPRPIVDPTLWSQVRGPRPLDGGPPGVLHYEPCINHPAWSEYLDLVIREAARVGYDGMFFDVNTLYCYCPHCQEHFDVYLLEKYGRDRLRRVFGTDDHREINLSTIYRDFEHVILTSFSTYMSGIWEKDKLGKRLCLENSAEARLDQDWRLLRCYMQGSKAEFPPPLGLDEYLSNSFGSVSADEIPESKKGKFIQTVLRYYFREFIESESLASLLECRFGSSDIRRRCCGTPRDLLLWVETQRFWCKSVASMFARLKRVGRIVFAEQGRGGDFYTVANLGPMSTLDALNKRRVDGINLPDWAPVTNMEMFEEMHQPGSLQSGVIISNVFAFRWAMAAGTEAGTLLYKVQDDVAADLAEAEVAAGGGGAFIQPGLGARESRKRWKRFFTRNADLWHGGISWAKVGLLYWSDQVFYEYPEHLAIVRRLIHVLAESQIPFDIVVENGLGGLAQYDVLIAPMLRYLNDNEIDMLVEYARDGGKLVIVDPFGTENKYAEPRSEHPLADFAPASGDFQSILCGRGKLLRLQDTDVPAGESDLWCLMEERANTFGLAREYLNSARQRDLKNSVDLGPKFVQKLENSLGQRLRWCPPGTDAGVYLHPYRLPAGRGRPERIVVHLVNYRVPILMRKGAAEYEDPIWAVATKAGEPVVQVDVHITLPIPEGKRVKRVRTVSPTDEPATVTFRQSNTDLELIIDRLRIYQALVIELES